MILLLFKKVMSVIELPDTIHCFSNYFKSNSNILKCEDAGIGALKVVPVAVSVLKSVDLTSDNLKILGVRFSYNKKNLE